MWVCGCVCVCVCVCVYVAWMGLCMGVWVCGVCVGVVIIKIPIFLSLYDSLESDNGTTSSEDIARLQREIDRAHWCIARAEEVYQQAVRVTKM